jgi:hypothetical protein
VRHKEAMSRLRILAAFGFGVIALTYAGIWTYYT